LSITIPPFNQYQSPIVPLRGLWNAPPVEGDKFITAEIDWLVTTTQQAVQFAVSANSPVSFSQIVALAVDNSRSGADVDFVFSDSGFVLTVPAQNQGVFPVFTNGLMFYAIALNAIAGDVTTFQVLNSMPPPSYINPSIEQNNAGISGVGLTNGSTQAIPLGVSGTLNTIAGSISIIDAGASAETAQLVLVDGAGRQLWETFAVAPAGGAIVVPVNVAGLNIRFSNGVTLEVINSTVAAGAGNVVLSLYYSQP
jgi:hypothetical protein